MVASIRELADPEKLLAMFEAAQEKGIEIERENIDTYVYLLKARDIPFSYSFVFHPLPHSDELREDVFGLIKAGYLTSSQSIRITSMGISFVQEIVLPHLGDMYRRIGEYLVEFIGLDRYSLSEAVYARIV